MDAVKKLTAVAAMLFLVLVALLGLSAGQVIFAAESEGDVSNGQLSSAVAAEDEQQQEQDEDEEDTVVLTKGELPMAEAKVNVLETQTEQKGMSSFLGFTLVAAAAVTAGGAVALRAKLGRNRRGYVPGDDLTLLKLKRK
jgi:hypothetical protein